MGDTGVHILLIEDNPGDARLAREMLRGAQGVSIDVVDSLSAAEVRLSAPGVDLILLDLGLPESRGLETLARVRTRRADLPVVVLTSLDDEALALEAVRAGAQDYLVKGRFDESSLPRSIRYATERQRVEAALHASEERYRMLFNDMPVGVYRTGEDGRILDANPALAALLGYDSPAELIGHGARDFYAEPEALVRWRQAAEQKDVLHDGEIQLRTKDGALIWARESGRLLRDKAGQLFYYQGTLSDITKRKGAEEALRESEERYRTLFNDMPVGIYRTGEDGRILDANPAMAELLGYDSPAELVGLDSRALYVEPEEQARWRQAIEKEGVLHDAEVRLRRKDGRPIWARDSGRMVRDPSGRLMHFEGTLSDITERKRAEEALHQALAQANEGKRVLDALMEHVPEGITIADAPDVRIRMVSRYGRDLTGKPQATLEGITVDKHAAQWDMYCTDGVTPARNEDLPLTRATQKGVTVKGEEWVLGHPSGKRIPILCNAGPIRDEAGNITGGVMAWRDITERKREEAQLNEQLDELRRWHKATLGRETRILDLKREVNEFLAQSGRPPRYPSAETENA